MLRNIQFISGLIKFSLFALLFSSPLYADSTNSEKGRLPLLSLNEVREDLMQAALDQKLYLLPRWQKLLHYKPDWQKGYESIVDDEAFFVSEQGKYEPKAELLANLRLFLSEKEADKSRACWFPARARFFEEALGHRLSQSENSLLERTGFGVQSLSCHAYQAWRKENPVEQAWLIFPTAFLNSPSSMFGHTLLRFDLTGKSALLSKSVTYAAHADDQEQSISYAFKGLFGGHPGYFSMLYYHKKVKEYTRTNNRDIWEYQLNLNEDETNWIMAHLWELSDIRFDYYFSTQNCSYQLLSILEVARPWQDLTTEFDYLAIPVDTIRALEQRNWITKKQFRASENRLFYAYLEMLTQAEKDLVLALQKTPYSDLAESVSLLTEARQRLVLEAAYKLRNLNKDKASKKTLGLSLLKARSKLGKSSQAITIEEPVAPEKGHLSHKIGFGAASFEGQSQGLLDIKLTLHSLEDPLYGFDKGSQINFLHQKSTFDEEGIQLEMFDLLSIRSLTPSDEYITNTAWQVNTGLARHLMPDGSRRLNKALVAGFGRSWHFASADFYLLAGGQLEASAEYQDYLALAPKLDAGVLVQNNSITSELNVTQYRFLNAKFTRLNARWTASWALKKNQNISVNLAREEILGKQSFNQVGAQFNLFF